MSAHWYTTPSLSGVGVPYGMLTLFFVGWRFMATHKDRLSSLTPDDRNVNRGTPRGTAAIAKSLKTYGAGRSILVDRAGRIIAGNKTAEAAAEAGMESVRVIETDGTELVVVKRTDLDLDSAAARELAIADNRTAELNLDWDGALLSELSADLDVDDLFSGEELAAITPPDWQGDTVEPEQAYSGMPAHEQEDQTAFRSLIVHFESAGDVEAFCALTGISLTPKSRWTWFPPKPYEDMTRFRVTDES